MWENLPLAILWLITGTVCLHHVLILVLNLHVQEACICWAGTRNCELDIHCIDIDCRLLVVYGYASARAYSSHWCHRHSWHCIGCNFIIEIAQSWVRLALAVMTLICFSQRLSDETVTANVSTSQRLKECQNQRHKKKPVYFNEDL